MSRANASHWGFVNAWPCTDSLVTPPFFFLCERPKDHVQGLNYVDPLPASQPVHPEAPACYSVSCASLSTLQCAGRPQFAFEIPTISRTNSASGKGKRGVGAALLGGRWCPVPPSMRFRLFLETRSIPLHLALRLRDHKRGSYEGGAVGGRQVSPK